MTYTNAPHANSDIIKILLDVDDAGAPLPVNPLHARNPQKQVFLNAKMTGNTSGSGLGSDYLYRDPWGHPYVITLDLNYDNNCDDDILKTRLGIIGSVPVPVMIWSFGPDGLPGTKDDVKSW